MFHFFGHTFRKQAGLAAPGRFDFSFFIYRRPQALRGLTAAFLAARRRQQEQGQEECTQEEQHAIFFHEIEFRF